MSEDLLLALRHNRPLPDEDFEALPAEAFSVDRPLRLASFLQLDSALAAVAGSLPVAFLDGLLPADARCRYSVLAGSERAGTIAAVDRAAGVDAQMAPVMRRRPHPALISGAEEVGEHTALVFPLQGTLRFSAAARVAYDFHWLRQPASSGVPTDLGLPLEAGTARLTAVVSGEFLAAVALDGENRLRLRVFQPGGIETAPGIRAEPPSSDLRELAAAILGIHQLQWLAEIVEQAKTRVPALGISPERLAAFFEAWSVLEPRAAAAAWHVPGGLPDEMAAVLEEIKGYAAGPAAMDSMVESHPTPNRYLHLDRYVRRQLQLPAGLISDSNLHAAAAKVQCAFDFAGSIACAAPAALERTCAARLNHRMRRGDTSEPVLDCSFDFTPAGLAAYRRALAGERIEAGPGVHPRRSLLTTAVPARVRVELHLPVLDRKQWPARWDALTRTGIECGTDGRLTAGNAADPAYQVLLALTAAPVRRDASFRLSYTSTRHLNRGLAQAALAPLLSWYRFDRYAEEWLASAPGDIDAALMLSLPGALTAGWFEGPGERDPDFFPVYSAVSTALQEALRAWVPRLYFAEPSRYADVATAWPLLVYQCSRPWPGRPRWYFTYDAMDPSDVERARRSAARSLPAALEGVSQLLAASGQDATAALYRSAKPETVLETVKRHGRRFRCLLVNDAAVVDNFIRLGIGARERVSAPQDHWRFGKDFVDALTLRLRRFYAQYNFAELGPLLLAEATRALAQALGQPAEIGPCYGSLPGRWKIHS